VSEKTEIPVTMAVRELRKHGVEFTVHLFRYEEKGGTAHSAKEMGVDEHAVIKTLIMETEARKPLVVLMHGDRQVSTKNLARHLGAKSISPCAPEVADRHSGYQVGGTSPFGLRNKMPIYVEKSILELARIYINGGKRGFLVGIAPSVLVNLLQPETVNVGIEG
jgi:Cys-tRNA(Pro) deacylase